MCKSAYVQTASRFQSMISKIGDAFFVICIWPEHTMSIGTCLASDFFYSTVDRSNKCGPSVNFSIFAIFTNSFHFFYPQGLRLSTIERPEYYLIVVRAILSNSNLKCIHGSRIASKWLVIGHLYLCGNRFPITHLMSILSIYFDFVRLFFFSCLPTSKWINFVFCSNRFSFILRVAIGQDF